MISIYLYNIPLYTKAGYSSVDYKSQLRFLIALTAIFGWTENLVLIFICIKKQFYANMFILDYITLTFR